MGLWRGLTEIVHANHILARHIVGAQTLAIIIIVCVPIQATLG